MTKLRFLAALVALTLDTQIVRRFMKVEIRTKGNYMKAKLAFPIFLQLLLIAPIRAQQTGAAVGTAPGSAIRNSPKAVPVPVPKPSCDSPGSAFPGASLALPDMVFERQGLVCVRHSDGRSEQLLNNADSGVSSADGAFVAYWVPDSHQLHILSVADRRDSIADTLPGAKIQEMVWSLKGHTMAYYAVEPKNPFGLRTINLDDGRRNNFPGGFSSLIPSPDPDYVFAVGSLSVERFRVSDGRRDTILPARNAERAAYSAKGSFLGIVSYTTAQYLDKLPEPSPAGNSSDDDSPDCTGADFFLILQSTATKQLMDVPFPEKFNTMLDFEFSPDESAIAVTFGVTGCDYPGDVARVYKISLPSLQMTPISPADRLGVQAHWSPDGKFIIYSDYTGGDSPLVAADVRTGRLMRLTNPGVHGPDTWQGWRQDQQK